MRSKVWVSFTWITFQPLDEETAKYYCIASSFCSIFHLVHVYMMRRTRVPCKVTRCTKLQDAQRFPELALRSTDIRALENLIFPAMWETSNLWYLFGSQSLTFIKKYFQKFPSKYWKNVSHIFFQLKTKYIKMKEWRTLLFISIFWNHVKLLMLGLSQKTKRERCRK